MNKSPNRDQQIQGILRRSGLLLLALAMAGCAGTAVQPRPDIKAMAKELDEIEAVQLADQSRSEPVSIEQATEKLTQEVMEPNEAQPVMKLTLEEVRAAALANNLDLNVELIAPSIAAQSVEAERAKFEPVFFGSAGYARTEFEDGNTVSNRSYDAGIDVPLDTGGLITASAPSADFDGVSEAAVSVSYIQSLLRGAGTRINTDSIRIAMYNKAGVDAGTKLAAIRIMGNADAAYWYLYAAREALAVSREQYKRADDQLEHARDKVQAGSAARIEITRAEAGLAGRLDAVISTETAVRDRERDLRRIMNRPDMPLNAQVDILPLTEPDPKGLDLDEEELVAAALENRMELVEREYLLAINDIGVDQARNALLPELTLDYTYAAGGRARRMGGAFENIFDESSQDHVIGLSAAIPLGNQAAEVRFRRARLQRVRGELDRERVKQQICQEVYDAVDGLRQNWRRILAAEQGVVTALRTYKVEQLQFQLGGRTSTEVLNAASSLAEAQLRRISAFAEYEIAQVRLARATGTLLGHDRIRLEPVRLDGK